jgi:hypothetical protein
MDDFDSKNIKNLMQSRKLKGVRILKIVSDARKSGEAKIIIFSLIEFFIENLFTKRSYEYLSLNCI